MKGSGKIDEIQIKREFEKSMKNCQRLDSLYRSSRRKSLNNNYLKKKLKIKDRSLNNKSLENINSNDKPIDTQYKSDLILFENYMSPHKIAKKKFNRKRPKSNAVNRKRNSFIQKGMKKAESFNLKIENKNLNKSLDFEPKRETNLGNFRVKNNKLLRKLIEKRKVRRRSVHDPTDTFSVRTNIGIRSIQKNSVQLKNKIRYGSNKNNPNY